MGYYHPLKPEWWAVRATKEGDWKAGMLVYTCVKPLGLKDLHIIVSKPSGRGCYSDGHVTFVSDTGKVKHVYYQVNNDELVADYVLCPKGWEDSYWVNWQSYKGLRERTEEELLNFVRFWRVNGRLEAPPRAVG